MTDVLGLTATAALDLLAARDVSSVALTQSVIDRIDARNSELNVVVEFRREQALAEAAAADAAVERGPLQGLPMTIKESFDVAGMQTTWGNPAFAGNVAQQDSTVVRRLRAAGAVIVGKSNVAMMLGDNQTANPLYGATNNPWDTARTPGGSSGGAAAALAAGMTFLEFGSDLSGSIRNPASFTGVFGLRPTAGIVPLTGMAPPGPPQVPVGLLPELSVVGPLARSAADLRLALRVAAGPERPDATAYRWRLPAPRHDDLRDFRVGYVLDHPGFPVSNELIEPIAALVDALAAARVSVTEGWPTGTDPARQFEDFGFLLNSLFGSGDEATYADFVAHDNRRIVARADWCRYFDKVDVFLCPVNTAPAFPHDSQPFEERTLGGRPYHEQFFWTAHAALAGVPAASVPIGVTHAGLPVGVQVIGPRCEDDTALRFAELLGAVSQPAGLS